MTISTHLTSPLAEVYAQYPFPLTKGDGVYVYDQSGRRYIDFYGGHAVSLLGHNPPEVMTALEDQGKELMFYSNLARIPLREIAATKLLEFAGGYFDKVFFCNSGGEANENALKIALMTGMSSNKAVVKDKLVGFSGGFHGRTALSMSVTDKPEWHSYLKGRLGNTMFLFPNDLSGLVEIDQTTAAVILEPIQSIGGVIEFEYKYLQALRLRCSEVGALLIFDEVQTGMGRTGIPFVSGFSGVMPDMMTLAKGLAGGFPIGAVCMQESLYQQLKVGDLGATFGGGPLALAAMQATIETIQNEDLIDAVRTISDYGREKFQSLHGVMQVRGRGFLLGLLLNVNAAEVQKELFERGIIVGTTSNKHVLHLLPPFTLQKVHIDELCYALKEIL